MKKIYTLLFALMITSLGFGQSVIYDADFSNDGDGFPGHTTASPPVAGPTSVGPFGTAPNAWTLSYVTTPATDGTSNTFEVVGGELQSDDWGGQGIFTSQVIDVSAVSTVDISALGVNSGANDNNFTYFYILDGGSRVETVIGATSNGNPVNYSITGLDVSGANDLQVGFEFSENGSGDGYDISEFTVTDTAAAASTEVSFIGSSATVSEGVGTFELEFTIVNEDAAATSFDVVLTVGDNADIDGYITETVTFPGGSTADQVVELTITDDALFESDETLTFEIQNVTGGSSAVAGSNNSFDLTITNNDAPPTIALPYSEDFSNCGTAQWVPFDENASNSWTCASGAYTMNGFPNTDDIDWLISNFSIDFDLTSNENIAVTTSEQFGDDINDVGEFELRYSTDYAGFGDPTTATWTALAFDPNNTSTGFGASADSVTIVDASGITGTAYLAFFYDAAAGSGPEEWNITEIIIQEGALPTSVEFVATSATVAEDSVSYDLEFSITNEDATNDTTFDVVLTAGDNADIDGYTTQTVTFLAGTNTNQTVTVTITDDLLDEPDETLTFEIQNVLGGNSAAVGTNNTFDLTISASDAPAVAEGWQISSENTAFVIDFDTTEANVNNDVFNGTGFDTPAASGQLDSQSWAVNGFATDLSFGGTETSGDYARGASTGGVSTGGIYAFDTGGSNSSFGIQPGGSDFTPGTITIRAQNQTGNTVTAADVAYLVYVFNDQGRASSFNFSYSTDDSTYTDVAALDLTTDEAADGSPAWVSNSRFTSITGLSIANGEYLYLRWSGDDVSGSGSRDEMSLDDISLTFNPVGAITYTYNGTWSPSNPDGISAPNDNIVIESGNAVLSDNVSTTSVKSVTINPGASLSVNAGGSLQATDGITLESTSTTYSSLLVDGGSIIGTELIYERFVNSNALGNDLISAPVGSQSWSSFLTDNDSDLLDNAGFPTTIYAFAPFDKTTGDFENFDSDTVTNLVRGVGYRAATDVGTTLTFRGSNESGTVSVDISNSGPAFEEWNLVGNPFPSYLNVQAFLNHDVGGATNLQLFDASSAAIYGYDGNASNGWTLYNLANTTASTVMAPGQGFFVSADATNAPLYDLEFTDAMRSAGTTDDFIVGRNAELIYLKVSASTNSNSYTTDFYFNNNASLGFDFGYDAEVWGSTAPDFGIYSHLVQDNTGLSMALQALNASDLADVTIPLGVNANQGEQLTFSIADTTLPASVNVYLDDVVANTTTLLNNSDYVITPNTNLSGTGRFFLRTSEDALSTIENSLDAINIFALNNSRELVVSGQLKENTVLDLFDIQGRKVLTTKLDNSTLENRIDVSNLNGGVYVVTVLNNGQQKTQKVIIK